MVSGCAAMSTMCHPHTQRLLSASAAAVFLSTEKLFGVRLLLQYLLQSCSLGGGGEVEDMCYKRLRAEDYVN
jgi:hypothetical protein